MSNSSRFDPWRRITTGQSCTFCGSCASLYERGVESPDGYVSYEIECSECKERSISDNRHDTPAGLEKEPEKKQEDIAPFQMHVPGDIVTSDGGILTPGGDVYSKGIICVTPEQAQVAIWHGWRLQRTTWITKEGIALCMIART